MFQVLSIPQIDIGFKNVVYKLLNQPQYTDDLPPPRLRPHPLVA